MVPVVVLVCSCRVLEVLVESDSFLGGRLATSKVDVVVIRSARLLSLVLVDECRCGTG